MKQFLLILCSVLLIHVSQASVWFVNVNASGSNDGSTWSSAYTDLQSAFSAATSGDSIWVAKGTYKPTSGTNRTIYFRLKNGVSIFGGFAGNETSVSSRNISANLTILSGDIGNAGSATDNTNHVVYGTNISSTVIIDGFRITGGYYGYGSEGAGIYLNNCKTIIRNTHITDNSSGFGGGIYQYIGSLEVLNCRINDNVASSHTGAAIHCEGTSGITTIINTQFRNNVVDQSAGNGILFVSGDVDLLVDRCEFSGNNAKAWGVIYASSKKSCRIINTTVIGNYCREAKYVFNGGISSSDFSVINCTISGNHADSTLIKQGNYPAVYVPNNLNTRLIRNCIVYNNTSSADFSNNMTVSNCIISKTYSNATKSLIVNPQFINPGNRLNAPFVMNGLNYELQLKSPAIDQGNDTYLSGNDSLDFNGNKREIGNNVDIGAMEKQYCLLNSSISADGPRDICQGKSLNFYADSGNYWIWNNSILTRTLNATSAGKYSLISLDTIKGCRGVAEDSLTVHTAQVKISGNLRFCKGDSSLLSATGNGIAFTWNNADTGQSIYVYTEGKYLLSAMTDKGCYGKDSVLILVDTLPILKILISESSGKFSNDAVMCKGASISLTASGGSSYLWSDSSVNAQLIKTAVSDTAYAVRVKNVRGCVKWSEPVLIKVNALPTAAITVTENSGLLNSDANICNTDSIILKSNTQNKYSWNTGSKLQTLRLKPSLSANYTVTVSDSNECQASASVYVTVHPQPLPVISMVNNQLQTGLFTKYRWYLNDTLIPGANNRSLNPPRNGKYTVEAENEFGCKKLSATYDFKTSVEQQIIIHFRFNPQPINEKLYIETDYSGQYTLMIYNALGEVIFSGQTVTENGIDASGWQTGFYIVKILDKDHHLIGFYKLIKI